MSDTSGDPPRGADPRPSPCPVSPPESKNGFHALPALFDLQRPDQGPRTAPGTVAPVSALRPGPRRPGAAAGGRRPGAGARRGGPGAADLTLARPVGGGRTPGGGTPGRPRPASPRR